LTTRLLNLNGDCYSVWNFRREVIINIKSDLDSMPPEDNGAAKFQELCDDELRWLEAILPAHPKSYWYSFPMAASPLG
jgi:hypothetical protein